MTEETHRLEGLGTTIEEANRSLGSRRGDLTKKFETAGVPTDVQIERIIYRGAFTLRGKCRDPACTTEFTVKSEHGWDALNERAGRAAGNLSAYDAQYAIEQHLALTPEQRNALKPRDTGAFYERSQEPRGFDALRL